MATNITANGTTTFSGVNVGKIAHVKVLGTWGGASIDVKTTDGNGAWTTELVNGTKTNNFSNSYQVFEEAGLQLVTTLVTPNTTTLWAQVIEARS